METDNPPSLPPDTADTGGWYHPGEEPDPGSIGFTEGTESIDTTLTKKQDKELNPEKYMLIHPVYFEVTNESNAACFLFELLSNLQLVDPMAHLLPHGDMPDETLAFTSTAQIPYDASLSSFAHAYLSGLRVNGNSLMGKFWLKCHKKFADFKVDPEFLSWLKGKNSSKRVTLDRMAMNGTERYSVGFFVNALAEQRLAENFNFQIMNSLDAATSDETPEFQCDVFTMYNGKDEPTRVYRMMTNSRANVPILQDQTFALLGKPSINLTFIPYNVWEGLNEEKKTAYRVMQQQFTSNVSALLLSGLRDTSLDINVHEPSNFAPNPQKTSILGWIKSTKSSDTTNMFTKVSVSPNGTVELGLFRSHLREAREWSKLALAAIAILSGIELDDERERAEEMFQDPERVWQQLEAGRRANSVPNQRSVFMDFQPPNKIMPSAVYKKRQPKAPKTREKLQLHFDMELVKKYQEAKQTATTVAGNAADAQAGNPLPSANSRRSRAKAKENTKATELLSTTNATSIDPHAAAAAAATISAQNAMNIGQATIAKFPPTALEKSAHGGKFYTVTDQFGNNVPVVYVSNVARPLNEKNLLQSRAEAGQQSNFSIIPVRQEVAVTTAVLPATMTPSTAVTPVINNTRGTPPKFNCYDVKSKSPSILKATHPRMSTQEVAAGQPVQPPFEENTADVEMEDNDDVTVASGNLTANSSTNEDMDHRSEAPSYASRLSVQPSKVLFQDSLPAGLVLLKPASRGRGGGFCQPKVSGTVVPSGGILKVQTQKAAMTESMLERHRDIRLETHRIAASMTAERQMGNGTNSSTTVTSPIKDSTAQERAEMRATARRAYGVVLPSDAGRLFQSERTAGEVVNEAAYEVANRAAPPPPAQAHSSRPEDASSIYKLLADMNEKHEARTTELKEENTRLQSIIADLQLTINRLMKMMEEAAEKATTDIFAFNNLEDVFTPVKAQKYTSPLRELTPAPNDPARKDKNNRGVNQAQSTIPSQREGQQTLNPYQIFAEAPEEDDEASQPEKEKDSLKNGTDAPASGGKASDNIDGNLAPPAIQPNQEGPALTTNQYQVFADDQIEDDLSVDAKVAEHIRSSDNEDKAPVQEASVVGQTNMALVGGVPQSYKEVNRPPLKGKKARISSSPATKSVNQESVAVEAGLAAMQDINKVTNNSQLDGGITSKGAAASVDANKVHPSPEQPSLPDESVNYFDTDEFPTPSEIERDIAQATTWTVSETANQIRSLQLEHITQLTKPDAGESADTGRQE